MRQRLGLKLPHPCGKAVIRMSTYTPKVDYQAFECMLLKIKIIRAVVSGSRANIAFMLAVCRTITSVKLKDDVWYFKVAKG
jgi:hypothetical protein